MAVGRSPCTEAVCNLLPGAAATCGIELTAPQLDQYAELCRLLLQHNQAANLTAITDPDLVVTRHFVDSLAVAPHLPSGFAGDGIRAVDVGSGAGMPGLPLAIAFPHWSMTLVESVGKKATFCALAAASLGLSNVLVAPTRAEDLARGEARESFHLALARGVGPMGPLVEFCAPLIHTDGIIALYKSGDLTEESAAADPALKALDCRIVSVGSVPADLDVGIGHRIVIVENSAPPPPDSRAAWAWPAPDRCNRIRIHASCDSRLPRMVSAPSH